MTTPAGVRNRTRALCDRALRAIQRSLRLYEESQRTLNEIQQRRVDARASARPRGRVVWATSDGLITCAITVRSADCHELSIAAADSVMFRQTYWDPVDASDEAERLRSLYVSPEPSRRSA